MEQWDACDGELPGLDGRECFGGLDLASTKDVAAFVLVFPLGDGKYAVQPHFWVPRDGARIRAKRDRVPYDDWIRRGLMEATEGNVIDYDFIRDRINELGEQYNIRDIAVDTWAATQIITQLMGDGFEMTAFRQGFKSLSPPSKEFEALVLSGRLCHGGHPVLRWMASNVMAEEDAAGNIKPSKKKSREKIDGIVATVMAIGRAGVAAAPVRSRYEMDEPVVVSA